MQTPTVLSPHFTREELCLSEVAVRHGIRNVPGPAVVENLTALCKTILEPLREALGPVHILSGYRSAQLNATIGGARKSQHVDGLAADLVVPGVAVIEVARWLYCSGLPFDQLIYEGRWVHVSVAAENKAPRREVLTARFDNGRAHYTNGLPGAKA